MRFLGMDRSFRALTVLSLSLCLLTVTGDEFHSPTHTRAVQLLSPRQGQMISADGQGLWVVFAAPDGAWVRILIDRVEVVRTNSSNKGQISGVGSGVHSVEAELLDVSAFLFVEGRIPLSVKMCGRTMR